jgi:hypothetical protein|tara:strand:+ start:285 stop:677 length:393 start_codon:yes stop_codon:yes gene_type:complete
MVMEIPDREQEAICLLAMENSQGDQEFLHLPVIENSDREEEGAKGGRKFLVADPPSHTLKEGEGQWRAGAYYLQVIEEGKGEQEALHLPIIFDMKENMCEAVEGCDNGGALRRRNPPVGGANRKPSRGRA